MLHGDLIDMQWPVTSNYFGEDVVYTDANGTDHTVAAVFSPRTDEKDMAADWEMRALQAELHIHQDDFTGITFTPGEDTVLARSQTYTVLQKEEHGGGTVYKFLLERTDLTGVHLRGRIE